MRAVRVISAAAASDFIAPGAISRRAIDAYVSQALAADSVRADWRRLATFDSLDAARVTVPTLLMIGQLDPFLFLNHHGGRLSRIDVHRRGGAAPAVVFDRDRERMLAVGERQGEGAGVRCAVGGLLLFRGAVDTDIHRQLAGGTVGIVEGDRVRVSGQRRVHQFPGEGCHAGQQGEADDPSDHE